MEAFTPGTLYRIKASAGPLYGGLLFTVLRRSQTNHHQVDGVFHAEQDDLELRLEAAGLLSSPEVFAPGNLLKSVPVGELEFPESQSRICPVCSKEATGASARPGALVFQHGSPHGCFWDSHKYARKTEQPAAAAFRARSTR